MYEKIATVRGVLVVQLQIGNGVEDFYGSSMITALFNRISY